MHGSIGKTKLTITEKDTTDLELSCFSQWFICRYPRDDQHDDITSDHCETSKNCHCKFIPSAMVI